MGDARSRGRRSGLQLKSSFSSVIAIVKVVGYLRLRSVGVVKSVEGAWWSMADFQAAVDWNDLLHANRVPCYHSMRLPKRFP